MYRPIDPSTYFCIWMLNNLVMSKGDSQGSEQLMADARLDTRGEGEPILTATRKLQMTSGSTSPRCNLTSHSRDILGMRPQDEVTIEVYLNKLVITKKDNE